MIVEFRRRTLLPLDDVSAYNFAKHLRALQWRTPFQSILNGLDAEAVLAWIDNFCGGKPLAPIVDAAGAFAAAHPH